MNTTESSPIGHPRVTGLGHSLEPIEELAPPLIDHNAIVRQALAGLEVEPPGGKAKRIEGQDRYQVAQEICDRRHDSLYDAPKALERLGRQLAGGEALGPMPLADSLAVARGEQLGAIGRTASGIGPN